MSPSSERKEALEIASPKSLSPRAELTDSPELEGTEAEDREDRPSCRSPVDRCLRIRRPRNIRAFRTADEPRSTSDALRRDDDDLTTRMNPPLMAASRL